MRRCLLFLFLLASVSGFLAACNRGEPTIAVESAQLDLGNVPNGEIATRDLTVRNTGDALLIVADLTTSCGCTTATLEPMELAPGENGVLHIEFDSGAHGQQLTGPLVRQVFITSNDPVQSEVTVELAANVTPPLQVENK